jgi:hypothetical protein
MDKGKIITHRLKLLLKLRFAAIIVIDGEGFVTLALMLLNESLSFGAFYRRFSYLGGFYMYFGNGLIKP